MSAQPLLSVRELVVDHRVPGGLFAAARGVVRAVDRVSFELAAGETLGLVGESGCGKSTLARALVGLLPWRSGAVRFAGIDVARARGAERSSVRRGMQLVFQDARGSLDPRQQVGAAIAEGLELHRLGDAKERRRRVAELLEQVGLPAESAARWPHEFSGGQRQRIGLARALAVEPRVLLLDEPVAAQDRSVQAQLLNLLLELRERRGLACLLISHDLELVAQVSDRVAVMHLGELVEWGASAELLARPRHPFTRALLAGAVRGEPPSPLAPPPGCRFHPRCPQAVAGCRSEPPPEREAAPGHRYRCIE